MLSENKANVFISYSWDNEDHQKWVSKLAEIINENGGNAIIDKRLKYGGHLRLFMEKYIKSCDVVLMILTPLYKEKAENVSGGVGFEYNIITREIYEIIADNDKYIGVLREGEHQTSVPYFIADFKYVDLRERKDYNNNLLELIKQILNVPLNNPSENALNKPVMDNDYKKLSLLESEMISKAETYFNKLYVTDNISATKIKISLLIKDWEKEVEEYQKTLKAKFNPNKMSIAEDYLEDFKNNIFGKGLWTVNAALRTRDPDLARYKVDFRDADAEEIFDTVNGILSATHLYVESVAPNLDYNNIREIDDFHFQYLDKDGLFMNRIIGFGIRSELLHRYYPAYFPIMTQKSLWAMYFVCDSSKEFITIEQKNRKGVMRVSHNWQYPYDRFAYLMNCLSSQLSGWLKDYGIKLNPEYRFGYVNLFLSDIHKLHSGDIKLLHEWVPTE